MAIGLICAIPLEFVHLRTLLVEARSLRTAGTEFVLGTLDGREVVVAESGMGKVNAAMVATVLADSFGCTALAFSGVAGGVDPALAVGDVVIASRIIQHDCGVIGEDGLTTYQAGHVPFINPTDRLGFTVDDQLLRNVTARLGDVKLANLSKRAGGTGQVPRVVYGTVLSGDQYLNDEGTRDDLRSEFGASAVEMEGGSVAQVAEAFGIPWLVVRALSDLAGRQASFDFMAFADEVAASAIAILRLVLPAL